MEGIDFLSSMLLATLLGWVIVRLFHDFNKVFLIIAWAWKVAGTIALVLIFTYYYSDRTTSDIYRFFDDGLVLKSIALEQPDVFLEIFLNTYNDTPAFRANYLNQMNAWIKPYETGFYNDNHIMIKIHALMSFFSGGKILMHCVFFSFLSFIGILFLIKSLTQESSRNLALLLTSILPSAWIWLSGGLKEALLVFSLGLIIHAANDLTEFSIKRTLKLLLGLLIAIQIKVYFIFALAPLLLWDILFMKLQIKKQLYWPLLLLISMALLLMIEFVGFSPLQHIVSKQHDFINHTNEISPGSAFFIPRLEENYLNLIMLAPFALVNTLLRPFPWEEVQPAEWIMVLENTVILIFMILAWFGMRKHNAQIRFPKWILPFSLLILCLIGITTPVFGAIMRYKAPVVLLLIISMTSYLAPVIDIYLNRYNVKSPN